MSQRVTLSVSVLAVLTFTAIALRLDFDANEVGRLVEALAIRHISLIGCAH